MITGNKYDVGEPKEHSSFFYRNLKYNYYTKSKKFFFTIFFGILVLTFFVGLRGGAFASHNTERRMTHEVVEQVVKTRTTVAANKKFLKGSHFEYKFGDRKVKKSNED